MEGSEFSCSATFWYKNLTIISLFINRCLLIPYRSLYLASVRISGYIISPAIGHVVTIIPLWCVMIIVITHSVVYQRCFKIEMTLWKCLFSVMTLIYRDQIFHMGIWSRDQPMIPYFLKACNTCINCFDDVTIPALKTVSIRMI